MPTPPLSKHATSSIDRYSISVVWIVGLFHINASTALSTSFAGHIYYFDEVGFGLKIAPTNTHWLATIHRLDFSSANCDYLVPSAPACVPITYDIVLPRCTVPPFIRKKRKHTLSTTLITPQPFCWVPEIKSYTSFFDSVWKEKKQDSKEKWRY